MFPTDGYYLDQDQFCALIEALSDCGERDFFISEVEHSPDPFLTDHHWKCISPTYKDYLNLPLCVENAIYSAQGDWGILVSHEDHALIVAKELFWQAFRKRYKRWEKDYASFIEFWRQNEKDFGSNNDWLAIFLSHLTLHPNESE